MQEFNQAKRSLQCKWWQEDRDRETKLGVLLSIFSKNFIKKSASLPKMFYIYTYIHTYIDTYIHTYIHIYKGYRKPQRTKFPNLNRNTALNLGFRNAPQKNFFLQFSSDLLKFIILSVILNLRCLLKLSVCCWKCLQASYWVRLTLYLLMIMIIIMNCFC